MLLQTIAMSSHVSSSPSGLINLFKPPGMTAHDAVAVMRRRLGIKKIGHSGTLDPLACGVLPLAVGSATRLLPYLRSGKEYLAEIQFGLSTTTGDAAGEVIESRTCSFDRADLEAILPRFIGAIQQRPPMVSAVHYQGKRLYELARAGVTIADLPMRDVTIESLELRSFTRGPRPRALLRISCSAGTYVRSLAVDMGQGLGVPASLSFLLRTRAGDFDLSHSQTFTDAISWTSEETYLAHMARREATHEEAMAVSHGRPLEARDEADLIRLHSGDRLLAIYERRGIQLCPKTVFAATQENS